MSEAEPVITAVGVAPAWSLRDRSSPSAFADREVKSAQAALSQFNTTLPDWPDFIASKPSR